MDQVHGTGTDGYGMKTTGIMDDATAARRGAMCGSKRSRETDDDDGGDEADNNKMVPLLT